MGLSRNDTSTKFLALFLICLFPAGAYFVYDAPAAIMKYFQAGLSLSNSEYMSYYTWYSAPCIVVVIFGGIVVDKILGHRLGAVCFCFAVFLGQLMFAYGVSTQYQILSLVGRSITGAGVESIAVASNVYLDRWFKGTDLQPLAFGCALAVWRVSSSVSLMTMLPYYKNINTLKPQDGSSPFVSCKGCSKWDDEEDEWFKSSGEELYADVKVWTSEKEKDEYSHENTYYCYNKRVLDMCDMKTRTSFEEWNEDNKPKACDVNNAAIAKFREETRMEKYENAKCFEVVNGEWKWNDEACQCLDSKFYPEGEWAWIDEQMTKYKSDERYTKDITSIFGKDSDVSKKVDLLRKPFYWQSSMGDNLSGEENKELKQQRDSLVALLNKLRCSEEEFGVPFDFDRFAVAETEDSETTSDSWDSVSAFVEDMKSTGLYGGDCNATVSYLVSVSNEDEDERRKSIGLVYYTMLLVPVFAFVCGIILLFLDRLVDKNDGVNDPKQEEVEAGDSSPKDEGPKQNIVMEQVEVLKDLPLEIWILYLMCILFYCSVFLFVAQGQKFLLENSGVSEDMAGVVLAAVYMVAVPSNFVVGAIIKKTQNHLIFLTAAYIIAGCAHLILWVSKGFLPAIVGTSLLAVGYSCAGTTMWPLAALLVPEKITGRMFGFMYAAQQLGLTVVGKMVGVIKDMFGWNALEMFFILLCGAGVCCGVILIGRIGRNFPKPYDEKMREKNGTEEEKGAMLQAAN